MKYQHDTPAVRRVGNIPYSYTIFAHQVQNMNQTAQDTTILLLLRVLTLILRDINSYPG